MGRPLNDGKIGFFVGPKLFDAEPVSRFDKIKVKAFLDLIPDYPQFQAEHAYSVNDIIEVRGNPELYYKCLIAFTSGATFDAEELEVITNEWDDEASYVIGDKVTTATDTYYICLVNQAARTGQTFAESLFDTLPAYADATTYTTNDEVTSGTTCYKALIDFVSKDEFSTDPAAYDSTATYVTGNVVIEAEVAYKANQDISTPEAFDSTKWDELTDFTALWVEIPNVIWWGEWDLHPVWSAPFTPPAGGAEDAYIIKQTGYNKYLAKAPDSGAEGIVTLVNGDETDGVPKPANIGEATLKTVKVNGVVSEKWVSRLTNLLITTFDGTVTPFEYVKTTADGVTTAAFDENETTLNVFHTSY